MVWLVLVVMLKEESRCLVFSLESSLCGAYNPAQHYVIHYFEELLFKFLFKVNNGQ